MSLLSEYLSVLKPKEKDRILDLHLSQREREVLVMLFNYDETVYEELRIECGISAGNWDKLQSVLLRKCYDVIVPEGGAKLIQHLSTRYTLSKHIHKEMAHQRKVLLSTLDTQQRRTYFQTLLNTFLTIPLFDTNQQLLLKLKREYLAVVPNHERDIERCICTSLIRSTKISSLSGTMKLQKDRVDTKLELALLNEYKLACSLHSPKAEVYADLALFDYYAAVESDQQLQHIKRASEMIEAVPDFPLYDKQQIQTKYATSLYQVVSDFEGAYKEYESLFQKYPESKHNIYPAAKYVQVCLILSYTDKAKAILEHTFYNLLHHDTHTIAANSALNYAKYYTMTRQYDKAFAMIQQGMNLLKRKLYVQYEIEFRNLQTALFVMSGDTETALTVIERNLKYLRSKGFKSSNSDFHEFYSLLRDFILRPEQTLTSKNTQSILEKWSKGIYNIYGALLRVVITSATE
jgi:hypothetical protein